MCPLKKRDGSGPLSDELSEPGGTPPPIINAPDAVKWLIGAIATVHLLRLALPDWADYLLVETLAFDSSAYTDAGTRAAKPLALILGPVGHMLLHRDLLHLSVNMGLFLSFGAVIGRRMGAGPFVGFFTLSGIAGAATWFLLHPYSPGLLIGASGGISGMFGALARIGLARQPMPGGPPPLRGRRIALNFALVWLCVNFVIGLLGEQIFGAGHAIAWEAHLGGFAAGFLLIARFDGCGLVADTGQPTAQPVEPGADGRP